MNIDSIVEGIRKGDHLSISRAISLVETSYVNDNVREIISRIYSETGNAHVIGITGPPGIGKSTLIGRLSGMLYDSGKKVSVLAIDASSPFSGGSFLGNRIRMQESLSSRGIFMRSLANRGISGGISRSAWDVVKILDAAGSDVVIVETVGAGQADLEVRNLVDTVIVVLGPGLGDEIQAVKAGIMEIGDIFIVNKIDREGAFLAIKDIEDTLAMSPGKKWHIPVIGLNSLNGEGYNDLLKTLENRRQYISGDPGFRDGRLLMELRAIVQNSLLSKVEESFSGRNSFRSTISRLSDKTTDPYSAADRIIGKIKLKGD
jgi:LAO/AO transport system kinase